METNYPYRSKAMKPVNPMGGARNGEVSQHTAMGNTKPMHKPSSVSTGKSAVQGPYGGKAPQS